MPGAELAFSKDVLAPYAIVPGGSTLEYEVQLLRLSSRGPDELTQVSQGEASLSMSMFLKELALVWLEAPMS